MASVNKNLKAVGSRWWLRISMMRPTISLRELEFLNLVVSNLVGCLLFLCKDTLLRSFAPFCALSAELHQILCSFALICVRPRLEQPRLGV